MHICWSSPSALFLFQWWCRWLVIGSSIKGVLVGLGDEEQYGNQEAARVGFEE